MVRQVAIAAVRVLLVETLQVGAVRVAVLIVGPVELGRVGMKA